jgi:hypothetical protein
MQHDAEQHHAAAQRVEAVISPLIHPADRNSTRTIRFPLVLPGR